MSTTSTSSAGKRIAALLDENSFVEIGGGVTARSTDFNMQEQQTPSDGVITGYGVIDGKLVFVYSQDASVMNGTLGEMHAGKIARMYDMALKMGAPVVGLIDCAGMRLQEATDALHGFGQIYAKKALASGSILQVDIVFGSCGGGMAVSAAMSDFTLMADSGRLFVNSPDAIKGNEKSKCDSASAAFQAAETGVADMVADEAGIITQARTLISMLPGNNEEDVTTVCTDDLNRACEGLASMKGNAASLLATISDGYVFAEVKKEYAKDMVTGFIRLNGMTVGAVANNTVAADADGNVTEELEPVLTARGCEKAADFVTFCDAFEIPVLTLTNTAGYKASMCSEKKIAKAAARLTGVFANATVPKVNVITGQAMGSAYLTMNSKSAGGADLVYAWEDAKVGMMDATLAAKIMYADEIAGSKDSKKLIREKAAAYDALQNSVDSAAGRGYVDTVIRAEDTRKYVIGAFEMLYSKREDRPIKKHGTKA